MVNSRSNELDVLLPVRAPAPWLHETLVSLQDQTVNDWNLLCTVADDSMHLVREIHEMFPNAVIGRVANDLPFPEVLNVGIGLGEASFVARMDQDDVSMPTRFAEQLEYLRSHPTTAVVGSRVVLIDAGGKVLGRGPRPAARLLKVQLLVKNVLIHPSVMMRRSTLTNPRPYSVEALNGEDYDLWLRLAASHDIACLEVPLLQYRVHGAQMSRLGAMDKRGRRRVGESKKLLSQSLGVPMFVTESLHPLWSLPQTMRSLVRSSSGPTSQKE